MIHCLVLFIFDLTMKYITPNIRSMRSYLILRWLGVSVLSAALAACASTAALSTPEAQVKQRAQVRWDAQIAGDWKTAYSLVTPSYRALRDLAYFRASVGGAVSWHAVEVVGVDCDETGFACQARIKMDYQVAARPGLAAPRSTYFNESWVLEEGQWYLHLR